MKTAAFTVTLEHGRIDVPTEIAEQVPPGERVEVVLLWERDQKDEGWRQKGLRSFEAAYSPEDSVYEQLIHDSSAG